MAKVSFFKALTLIGTLCEQLTEKSADGEITFEEGIAIASVLAQAAGIKFDSKGSQFTMDVITAICEAAKDNKITVAELIALGERICAGLGIELDTVGVEIK